jgi:signal transduction histidine kinase
VNRWDRPRSHSLAAWLAVGICSSVALLGWFGYRATREFRRSSQLLTQRRTDEAASLVVTALTRDMRGASESTLTSSVWEASDLDSSSHDIIALVASAFARYPYAEDFFTWDSRKPQAPLVFYTRPDRPPPWAPPGDRSYPVRVVTRPAAGDRLFVRISADASAGRTLSVNYFEVGDSQYQAVTLLKYADRLEEHLESMRGVVVNLSWTRAPYISELLQQVADISGEKTGLTLAIIDDHNASIAGRPGDGAFASRRSFPLTFYDPTTITPAYLPAATPVSWTVVASAGADTTLGAFLYGPEFILAVITLAGFALATGLVFTLRGVRASAELAEMRAEFMASVTHELKTPIASIQAMGETLSRGRLRDLKAEQEYAAVVTQQAKRLGRLVENALAYSRLTDVADAYSFEPLDLEDLVGASLAHFNPVFKQDCAISVDIPADLPSIHADRAAMELLLDNIIDNALRHSGATHLRIAAEARDNEVWLEITDGGIGIHRDDLARVTQKFARGRGAAHGGSGLGLAIVARIVDDHHGRFTIESTPGTGTTVRVMVPAASIVVRHPHAAAS